SGLVSLPDDPAACDGRAFGRRRGRVVRRVPDVSGRSARETFPAGSGRAEAGNAGGAPTVYFRIGWQDQPPGQTQTGGRWEPARSGRGALLLERRFLERAAAAEAAGVERERPAAAGPATGFAGWGDRPVPGGGPELLPAGRYSV